MAPPISPNARSLPTSTSAVLTGAMRNSSITPLVRSRTSDIATSVTARCWRISASTAGAKYEVTPGVVGATFTISAVVGAAITSGGMAAASGWPAAMAYPWPSAAARRMMSRLMADDRPDARKPA